MRKIPALSSLPQRALSGAVFVSMVVFCLWFSEYSMIALFMFFLFLLHHEFSAVFCKGMHKLPGIITVATSFALVVASFVYAKTNGAVQLFYVPLFLFISLPLVYIFVIRENDMHKLGILLLSIIYFAIPLSFSVLISFKHSEDSVNYSTYLSEPVLSLFFFIWIYDTFAYLSGTILGKNPLIERISPKKTWEGVAGGVLLTLIIALLGSVIFNLYTPLHAIAISLIVAVFGTLGDLFESWIKRSSGIKDFGNIMPGHGGALDRLDSFLFAAPCMWIYYNLVA